MDRGGGREGEEGGGKGRGRGEGRGRRGWGGGARAGGRRGVGCPAEFGGSVAASLRKGKQCRWREEQVQRHVPFNAGRSRRTQLSRPVRAHMHHQDCLFCEYVSSPQKYSEEHRPGHLLWVCESASSLAAAGASVLLSGPRSWSPGRTTTKTIMEHTKEFPNTLPFLFI